MLNLKHLFEKPQNFENPTIKNETRKIEIVNLTPNNSYIVPVKVKRLTGGQYMLILLSFNHFLYATSK